MTDTFYEVLGVSPDASTEEIESAYRDRLKETHPDLSDSEDASEATQRVIRARDVLTDEDERRRYDRIGHDAYVDGDGSTAGPDSRTGDDEGSSAAAAARRAGWGDGNDRSSGRTDRTGSTGRRSRRSRRARERTARERVDPEDGTRNRRSRTGADSAGGTDSTTTDGGHARNGPSQQARAAAAARRRREEQGRGETPSWTGSGGYSVRRNVDHGIGGPELFRASQSVAVLGMSFVLYPVMLFSAVFPAFPLVFNAMVAVCLVCFVLYLQSMPEIGVVVFGVWSLLVPLLLIGLGANLATTPAILAITGTVVPFWLSTSAFFVLYR